LSAGSAAPSRWGSRRLRLAVAALATTALASATLTVAVVLPAGAEPGVGRPSEVGVNWKTAVQDVKPSGRAPSREERASRLPVEVTQQPPVAFESDFASSSLTPAP
jgi:hypothetical protein